MNEHETVKVKLSVSFPSADVKPLVRKPYRVRFQNLDRFRTVKLSRSNHYWLERNSGMIWAYQKKNGPFVTIAGQTMGLISICSDGTSQWKVT